MQTTDRFRFLSSAKPMLLSASTVRLLARDDLTPQDAAIVQDIAQSLETTGQPTFQWGPQEQHFIEHCTAHHIVPYLIYRHKMSVFPRQHIVADFPTYVLIEPASPCNLRCVMCFQTDASFTKKSSGFMGYMDMGLYQDIIDQCAEGGTRALTFASRGEPTLHKKLPEMLRYAADKGVFFDIKLNTNGTLLDERMAHGILEAGTSIVVVSIDSVEPQQYSRIRVRGDFDDVLDNVRRFIDIREKHYPESRTEVRAAGVNLHSPRYGAQDEKAFGEFWEGIVDTVAMVDAEERWDTYNNKPHPEKTHPCEYLWERLYVWWDGRYNPCDLDYRSELSPGTSKEQSIRDVWHGEAYTRLRQAHISGERVLYNPCDRCGV